MSDAVFWSLQGGFLVAMLALALYAIRLRRLVGDGPNWRRIWLGLGLSLTGFVLAVTAWVMSA